MKKYLFSIAMFALLSGASAHAGILIEPSFSYIMSASMSPDPLGTKISGNNIDLRLGYSTMGFAIGVDASLGGAETLSNSSSTGNYKPANMGVFLSYKFPILVRAYYSYMTTIKMTDSAVGTYTGTGSKIGVQYTGLPFVAIGIEMASAPITNFTTAAGVSSAVSSTISETRLTLSLPFDI